MLDPEHKDLPPVGNMHSQIRLLIQSVGVQACGSDVLPLHVLLWRARAGDY
jgi:hypothetical protein